MPKLSYKKCNYQEETPILQRVERRHALLGMPSTSVSSNWQWHEMAAPLTPRKDYDVPESPTVSTSFSECSGNSGESTTQSKVVIKDSDLTKSWIYKNKKAAANEAYENSSVGTVTPTKHNTTNNVEDIESPKLEFSPFLVASRKRTPSTCCCYMFLMLITFVCVFGILSSIGGIIYLEIIIPRHIKDNVQTETTITSETETFTNSDVTIPKVSTNEGTLTEEEHNVTLDLTVKTNRQGKLLNSIADILDDKNSFVSDTVIEESTSEKQSEKIATDGAEKTIISTEPNESTSDCTMEECKLGSISLSVSSQETASEVQFTETLVDVIPTTNRQAEVTKKLFPSQLELTASIAKVLKRFQALSQGPSSRIKDREKVRNSQEPVLTQDEEKDKYLDRLRTKLFDSPN